MTTAAAQVDRRGAAFERVALALAVIGIVVLGLMLPGLGIVLAGGLALTAYRGNRRMQLTLGALGVLVTVLSISLYAVARSGDAGQDRGEPVIVEQPAR